MPDRPEIHVSHLIGHHPFSSRSGLCGKAGETGNKLHRPSQPKQTDQPKGTEHPNENGHPGHADPSVQNLRSWKHEYALSHRQLSKLLSHALPECIRDTFVDEMARSVKQNLVPSSAREIDPTVTVCKTPICLLRNAFRTCQSQCLSLTDWDFDIRRIPVKLLAEKPTDVFILDVTLNRKHSKSRVKNEFQFSTTVDVIPCSGPDKEKSDCDDEFRDILLYFPSASIFLTRNVLVDGKSLELAVPLLSSWLRLRGEDGQPANGAFIRKIHDAWVLRCGCSNRNGRMPFDFQIQRCIQFDDDHPDAPLLPPDRFSSHQDTSSIQKRKERYRECLQTSATNRSRCRKYVRSTLHYEIAGNQIYVIDQRQVGDITLYVSHHDPNGRPVNSTCVHITSAINHLDLMECLDTVGKVMLTGSLRGNCRASTGDCGSMYALGTMRSTAGEEYQPVVMEREPFARYLPGLCRLAASFASDKFPSVLHAIRQTEKVGGFCPLPQMGGKDGISVSMDVSIDLGNASHYDVGDCSQGFSIWTEQIVGDAKNWFFVLPNIQVHDAEKTYDGVAIQLFHGVAISWDGRLIRHGTSKTDLGNAGNHTHGWFWSANGRMVNGGGISSGASGDGGGEKAVVAGDSSSEDFIASSSSSFK